ncbi:MAG TPA: hypothetical protein VK146_01940 [Tabrizicola sp.]|nr:hypothetical protein [Tabrizicola sp.]
MRRLMVTLLLAFPALPAAAKDCSSLVASVCAPADTAATTTSPTTRKVLKVKVRPPAFAVGDRFPVEEHSLLMNPRRYGLEGSDGTWRYYALDGTVYRVDTTTAQIIEVIRDQRTWGLR